MQRVSVATGLDYRQRVCRAMDFIHAHLHRELSLEEIARAASFSAFHFHRIFSAVTGETVFGFVRRLRLERAANQLLGRPQSDITSIALDNGFSSSQNFAKAFRAHFGCSPSAFRRRKDGNKMSKERQADSLRLMQDAGQVERTSPQPERKWTMQKREVKNMPLWHVAYMRRLGPYGKATCEAAFRELMRWAGPRQLLGQGPMLGIYWDNPEVTAPANCRVDACLVVPEGTRVEPPVALQDVPGGPHLVCEFNLPPTDFTAAWTDAFQYLVQQGYECAERPCYELYYDDCSGATCRFDICIPLLPPE
ncbi:MAG: AraC family transcriptional regulator [Lentisphaerae bacterium]|jgi:AraC family transcriptional regulator|nr:AraC family transcriptional regulator [Lentisphaerota bacterium]